MEQGSGAEGKRAAPGRPAAPPATPDPKTEADNAGGGGDERDQDMDEFYALLGNIRAMRELLRTRTADGIRNPNKRRKVVEPVPLWRPTFALEDFQSAEEAAAAAGLADAQRALMDPSPSRKDRKGTKEEEEGGDKCKSVDLSLSL